MRQISFQELSLMDFSIQDLTASTWYWENGDDNDYQLHGRLHNMCFYLVEGERDYFIQNKFVCRLLPSTLLFIPDGYQYLTKPICHDVSSSNFGYVFCFDLIDRNGEKLFVDEPFRMERDSDAQEIYAMVQEAYQSLYGIFMRPILARAMIYRLLDRLSTRYADREACVRYFSDILPAVRHLQSHCEQNTSIASLCEMCHMAESTFRRKFNQFSSGVSPIKYRNELRVKKAEQLYHYSSHNLNEIAYLLGFCDAPHLCHVFRQITGRSLSRQ